MLRLFLTESPTLETQISQETHLPNNYTKDNSDDMPEVYKSVSKNNASLAPERSFNQQSTSAAIANRVKLNQKTFKQLSSREEEDSLIQKSDEDNDEQSSSNKERDLVDPTQQNVFYSKGIPADELFGRFLNDTIEQGSPEQGSASNPAESTNESAFVKNWTMKPVL